MSVMNTLGHQQISAALLSLVAFLGWPCITSSFGADSPFFPLRVSADRRHLEDSHGTPFFILGDTPWFIQKLKLEEVRLLMDDRLAKGYNTLFLELLDDSRIPSIDAQGHTAFSPETDITKPLEPFWAYAEQVMDEAEKRGLFIIHNSIWFGAGKGLWMHHLTPDNCRFYGEFIAKRFARFQNLMWMHVGDRNPDARLAACARELARACDRYAPHQLQTVHLQHEFASATAALASDSSCAVVYLPSPRTFTVNLARLRGPVTARWFDPTANAFQPAEKSPLANAGLHEFTPLGNNSAHETDWVLVLEAKATVP